jgi:hypothetical protein
MKFLDTFFLCLALACLAGWVVNVQGCDVATVVAFVIWEMTVPVTSRREEYP